MNIKRPVESPIKIVRKERPRITPFVSLWIFCDAFKSQKSEIWIQKLSLKSKNQQWENFLKTYKYTIFICNFWYRGGLDMFAISVMKGTRYACHIVKKGDQICLPYQLC